MNVYSRIVTIVMFAGICFLLIVPTALHNGNRALAIGCTVLFCAYLVANVVLWRRLRPRR